MKKIIAAALLLLLAVQVKADALEDFYQYLLQGTKYPEKAVLNHVQGKSLIVFKVNKGLVSEVKVHTELGAGCDVELVNQILAYPKYKSFKNGQYALTGTFKLEGSNAEVRNNSVSAPTGYIPLKLTVVAFAVVKNAAAETPETNGGKSFKVNWKGDGMILRGNEQALNQPKVFVDSVEWEYAALSNLDTKTIESITILRDDNATARFGPGAINGVILIHTKKEKKPSILPPKNR